MYEGLPLHGVGWTDLKGFLEEGRVEGTRLDYKRKWDHSLVRDACAMANTSGGDIIVGVKEIEAKDKRSGKTHMPDPEELLGEDGSRDWKTIVEGTIRGRTRPPVMDVEAKALPIDGKPGLAALVIRVGESFDTPHEVYVGSNPEIPVRRGANTVSAGLDDVERMIARREASRVTPAPLVPEFFERLLVPDPSYDFAKRGNPPTVAIAIRPRRASFGFAFDAALDAELQDLSMQHHLTDSCLFRATPHGVALEDPPSGTPRMRIEVRKDATIRGAWALEVEEPEEPGGARALDFYDLVMPIVDAVRFAGAAYTLRRPGTEMEVALGLSGCQGCRVRVGIHAPTRVGQIRNPGFYQQPVFADGVVRTEAEAGKPAIEDLVGLVRELSRFFGISMPDRRLAEYV